MFTRNHSYCTSLFFHNFRFHHEVAKPYNTYNIKANQAIAGIRGNKNSMEAQNH
jgi:hypothetical protein